MNDGRLGQSFTQTAHRAELVPQYRKEGKEEMKRVLLFALLLVFVTGATAMAAVKTWTVYDPIWVGEGTGPTVILAGLGPDGHDAWWRGNPADDWAQAHFKFDFADMSTVKTAYSVEFWCPATPSEYAVGWGPINWPDPASPFGGRYWAGADMGPRAGAWKPVTDAGLGTTMMLAKGEAIFFLWNPWGGGYANAISAVRITGEAIPEPSGLLALAAGFPALALLRRRK